MRELLRATLTGKPIIGMLEPEKKHGGLTRDEIRLQLVDLDARYERQGMAYASKYEMWGLAEEVADWGYPMPSGERIFARLFESGPIEWNRAQRHAKRGVITEQANHSLSCHCALSPRAPQA